MGKIVHQVKIYLPWNGNFKEILLFLVIILNIIIDTDKL